MIKCRSCQGNNLVEVLDLGNQYLSDFREDDSMPERFPLVLLFCEDCYLCQLRDEAPQTTLYTNNYGYYSGVNNTIKADLKDIVEKGSAYAHLDTANWVLDIGCNDGTLLSNYPDNIIRIGVDPVKKFKELSILHADYIIDDFFSKDIIDPIRHEFRKDFNLITTVSCFYDMPDPNKFVEDVSKILKYSGVWIIQQNYLGTMLKYNAYDNILAEHLEYYSLMALENLLERYGLKILKVELNSINGGSFRTYVSKRDKSTWEDLGTVDALRTKEKLQKLDTIKPYEDFAKRIKHLSEELYNKVKDIQNMGREIALLGASTRANTFLQYSGLDNRHVAYAVERNPAKWGKIFSPLQIPITSEDEFREFTSEYALIGPWFFADEIMEREKEFHKNGGKFIIPLPYLRIV